MSVLKTTNPNCSKCGGPMELTRIFRQSYCATCHAANMRATRPIHSDLAPEAKEKANARSYAGVYKRRGTLKQQPCEICGSSDSQAHHDDYSKPLEVRWLCREHHLEIHGYPQETS